MIAFLEKSEPVVKICGVTTAEQAGEIADMGVDAIGVNFWPKSKRFLPSQEREWLLAPHPVPIVGVFVNAELEEIRELLASGMIDVAQLHGDETPEVCATFAEEGLPFIKALGVKDASSLEQLSQFHTRYLLLDAFQPGEYGGGGKTFNWELAKQAVNQHPDLRIMLSGGLHPENTGEALTATGAVAADVASGVEASPGIKDLEQCRTLIQAVRSVLG